MNLNSYHTRIQERLNNASEIDKQALMLEREEAMLVKNLEATIQKQHKAQFITSQTEDVSPMKITDNAGFNEIP